MLLDKNGKRHIYVYNMEHHDHIYMYRIIIGIKDFAHWTICSPHDVKIFLGTGGVPRP